MLPLPILIMQISEITHMQTHPQQTFPQGRQLAHTVSVNSLTSIKVEIVCHCPYLYKDKLSDKP